MRLVSVVRSRTDLIVWWGLVATLNATFALSFLHVEVWALYPYPVFTYRAFAFWIALENHIATWESIALLLAFAFLGATVYLRARAPSPSPVRSPHLGLELVLSGVIVGAIGRLGLFYLATQQVFFAPSHPYMLVPGALTFFSLPLVVLGLGFMTSPRPTRRPSTPRPEDADEAEPGRNP